MLPDSVRRLRSVSVVASGSAIGNAVTFASSLALSRIFAPSEFGIFAALVALVMTFSTIVSGRLELAIVLPTSDRQGRQILTLGVAITTVFLTASLPLVLFLEKMHVFDALFPPRVVSLLWTVPVMLAPVAGFQLLNAWALRNARFMAIARRTVLQSVGTAFFQIIFGLAGLGVYGLVVGYFLGQLLGCFSLLVGAKLANTQGVATGRQRLITRYRNFPLILGPAGLLNSLGIQAPVLLISSLYGSESAGYFGLTQRVLAVPVILVVQAAGQVYSSELARLRRSGGAGALELFRSMSRQLAVVGLIVAALTAALSPVAFAIVFGETWRQSGELTRAMAISLGAIIVSASVSTTLIVYERTWLQFAWDSTRAIAVISTFFFMHDEGASLVATIWIYSAVATAFYAISWLMSRRTILNDVRGLSPSDPRNHKRNSGPPIELEEGQR